MRSGGSNFTYFPVNKLTNMTGQFLSTIKNAIGHDRSNIRPALWGTAAAEQLTSSNVPSTVSRICQSAN